MGEILPDGSIQSHYGGICQKCKKSITVNINGNEIGSHQCVFNCLVLNDDLFNHWATWFEEGKKTIETRFYTMKHRGDLVICCGNKSKTRNAGLAVCIVDLYDAMPMRVGHEKDACIEAVPGRIAHITDKLRHFSRKFKFAPCRVSGSFQSIFQIVLPDGVEIIKSEIKIC